MASNNPYYIQPANGLQALMLGTEAFKDSYGAARKEAAEGELKAGRQSAMQILMSGGDINKAVAPLIAAGDVKGAEAAIGIYQQQATEARAKAQQAQSASQFQQSHGLQRDQFKLAQQQAELAAKGIDYKEVDDGSGGKILVQINRATGQISKPPIAGADTEPPNPYAQGNATEGQANARLYASRMFGAESVLRQPDVVEAQTSVSQKLIRGAAGQNTAGNLLVSEGTQKREQAERDFVNATLRRESGAVINPSEFESAEKQYFPRPGDTKEVIAQKQRNRAEAIKGIAAAGGRSYRPPMLMEPGGELRPNAQKGAAPSAAQTKDGATATNPSTGQKIIFRNGQWAPVQ